MRSIAEFGRDLSEWLERLSADAKVDPNILRHSES